MAKEAMSASENCMIVEEEKGLSGTRSKRRCWLMQGRARTVVPYIWVSPSHIDIMLGLAWLARLSALKSLRGSHASRSTDFSLFAVPSLGRRNKDTREPLIPPCMRHGITGTQRETRRRIPFFFFSAGPGPTYAVMICVSFAAPEGKGRVCQPRNFQHHCSLTTRLVLDAPMLMTMIFELAR